MDVLNFGRHRAVPTLQLSWSCKQKTKVTRKLMKSEDKIRKNQISCKKPCIRENQDKKKGVWRGIRDRRDMIG